MRQTNEMSNEQGFSLIELMVVIAIGSIILTIGIPSFQQTTQNNRMATQVNNLLHTMNIARSEAVTRGLSVSVCKSSDGTSCAGAGGDWKDGWIAFVDADADGVVEPFDNDGDGLSSNSEALLEAVEGLKEGYTLKTSAFPEYLSYLPTGKANSKGQFVFCLKNDVKYAGLVLINLSGSARSGRDLNHDHIPENIYGTNVANCNG